MLRRFSYCVVDITLNFATKQHEIHFCIRISISLIFIIITHIQLPQPQFIEIKLKYVHTLYYTFLTMSKVRVKQTSNSQLSPRPIIFTKFQFLFILKDFFLQKPIGSLIYIPNYSGKKTWSLIHGLCRVFFWINDSIKIGRFHQHWEKLS